MIRRKKNPVNDNERNLKRNFVYESYHVHNLLRNC